MNFLFNTLRFCVLIAFASMFAHAGFAAEASAKPSKGYGRINFTFAAPTKLSANVAGTTATLKFSAPLTQSPQTIASALPGYVTKASVSADKRTLTLTLNKPYRIRQFISGSNVGVDLVGEAAATNTPSPEKKQETAAKEKQPQQVKKAETEKKFAKKEKKKEANKEDKKEVKKPSLTKTPPAEKKRLAPKPATKIKTESAAPKAKDSTESAATATTTTSATRGDPILSTKHENRADPQKPAPAAVPEKSTAAKTTEPLLTTKTATEASKTTDPILTTKDATSKLKAAIAEPSKLETTSAKVATAPAPSKDDPADVTEPVSTITTPGPTEPAPPPPKKQTGPFVVGTRTINDQTAIHFPWTERTAAAVLTRGQDIWVIFSQAQTVNLALLRSVMPKQVINITQYPYAETTVLRLTTDGNLSAYATQTKGSYGWDIIFSTKAPAALIDTALSANNVDGTMRLVAAAFDMAPAVRFYDPTIGDQLIITPAYENGRGVGNARNFPEFSVLPTPQGIAIATSRNDLSVTSSRIGLIISGTDGLALSENLPRVSGTPSTKTTINQGVMIPYAEWYIQPEKITDTLSERLINIGNATHDAKPESLMDLARVYLGLGQCPEANGLLTVIAQDYPDYYRSKRLALLSGACQTIMRHMDDANAALAAPELNELDEATMWREVAALFTPPPSTAQIVQQATQATTSPTDKPGDPVPAAVTPVVVPDKPVFHFLKYNKSIIHYYPPAIRQWLAVVAADAYIADGQPEKALAVFDSLIRDGIIAPVELDAEFTLGTVAVHKKQPEQAYEIFDRLATQNENRYIAARARYEAAKLRYATKQLSADEAIDIIEQTRLTWRGDTLERQMLDTLTMLYREAKRYDDILRTKKNMLDAFPNTPDYLQISTEMSELFEQIYLDGLADEMDPLKALGLFYEFRDLTPLGEKGDKIIQLLADRLAAIDLLDRAIQLLEHQIKFRATGDARMRIGAKLALLHLLNKQPQEALDILEISNFGDSLPELKIKRQQLAAEALLNLGKNEEAVAMIAHDNTATGALLRLNILWAMRDWPSVINQGEDLLSARPNLTDPLTPAETELLLKLALAYSFEGDLNQLRYLKDYYTNLIPDSASKQIFTFMTNDTTPLDAEDFDMVAKQISRTESFLSMFREKIAAGKLSEAIP